jgi:hypothetical protein
MREGIRVQLKTLGMSRQRNAGYERGLCWIDYSQATASVAHYNVAGARIQPDVVSIIGEIDRPCRREIRAAEQAYRSVAGACYRKDVSTRRIGKALRLLEAFDAADHGPSSEVDHVHRSVTKFGDEQALAREIDRKVVDAPGHALQLNCALKGERCRFRRTTIANRHAQERREEDKDWPHRHTSSTIRQLRTMLIFSSAARRPVASFYASSFAQKCMKKRRG